MLIHSDTALDVIGHAMSLGADFCDLFIEKTQIQRISFNSQKVKDVNSGIDSGIGVRLIFGETALYAYSNSSKKEDLIAMVNKLSIQYKKNQATTWAQNFTPANFKQVGSIANRDVALSHKVEKLKNLDEMIRRKSDKISQVEISLLHKNQNVEIYNSEGLYASETRPYIRLFAQSIAKDGQNQSSGYSAPGRRGGIDFLDQLNFDELSEKIVQQTLVTLDAKPCPAGQMPVVIENGFGGVIFHEACGHLLETTAVEKKSSVLWDKKGELVAHPALSAVDDGTNDELWGSLSVDDEGMPTQKTQLIKDGILVNFICDKMGNLKTGHPRTGSGRKESYKFAPASRMRNTYIDNGKHTLDDMLQSMGDGLYAKAMGGGSVNPSTGEFNFAVLEGYLVKNGKLTEAVKGATLIGGGEDILKKISMVGKNLSYEAGMCGSVSGSLPVTVGQPALKVDDILVGGQS